jgi:hypothetical protein
LDYRRESRAGQLEEFVDSVDEPELTGKLHKRYASTLSQNSC